MNYSNWYMLFLFSLLTEMYCATKSLSWFVVAKSWETAD